MLGYIREIQRQFVREYGFPEHPKRPGIPKHVPDGVYTMKIDGKVDLVRVLRGKISCGKFDQFVETPKGYFKRDAAGLWHYEAKASGLTCSDYAADAAKHRPEGLAAWYWFNGTPAPILLKDSPRKLDVRWSEWRERYQADPKALLELLERCAK